MTFLDPIILEIFERFKNNKVFSQSNEIVSIVDKFSNTQRIQIFCLGKKYETELQVVFRYENKIWEEINSLFRNDYTATNILLQNSEDTLEMITISLLLDLLDFEDFRTVIRYLYHNLKNPEETVKNINKRILQILYEKEIITNVLIIFSSLLRFFGVPLTNIEEIKHDLYHLFPEEKLEFDRFFESPIMSCQKYPDYLDEIAEQLNYDADFHFLKNWLDPETLYKLEQASIDFIFKIWKPKNFNSIDDFTTELKTILKTKNHSKIPLVFNSLIKRYSEYIQPKKVDPRELSTQIPSEELNRYVEKLAFSPSFHKKNKLKITFLSGSQIGTMGILVTTPQSIILMDYGYSVSNSQIPYYDEGLNHLDAILVSHAHLDHIGAIPYLYGLGYRGNTYGSLMTKNIANFLLIDNLELIKKNISKEIREKDSRFKHLSQHPCIYQMLDRFVTIQPGKEYQITPDLIIKPINAHHIQGSLAYKINFEDKEIFFSGDINLDSTALFKNKAPSPPFDADLTIMDSTYYEEPEFDLKKRDEILFETVKEDQRVIIPAFSVGRAQEIMIKLDKKGLTKERKVSMLGMATKVARISGLKTNGYLSDQFIPPFDNEVIITGGGMLGGGIARDLVELTKDDPNTTIILCGYLGKNTLGHRLRHNLESKYKQKIVFARFSSHSSSKSLNNYLTSVRGKKALVHVGALTKDPFNEEQKRNNDSFVKKDCFFPNVGSSIEI